MTRKITRGVARIARGQQEVLELGNLNARRDWGYAGDYVECMWRMLRQREPEDYVIATGETHTVREFAREAFACVGITLDFQGSGLSEQGIDRATGRTLLRVNPVFFRPAEVDILLGDPTKAREKLGWNPTKTGFQELVRRMVEADIRLCEREH